MTLKANDIKVGKNYVAKVSGKLTTVRVDAIRERTWGAQNEKPSYDVTNLANGRRTVFRTLAKFHYPVATPRYLQESHARDRLHNGGEPSEASYANAGLLM